MSESSILVRESEDLAEIQEQLLAAERVVVTTHIRPDGDAVGSAIAAALFLRALGKEATVLDAEVENRRLNWFVDQAPKDLIYIYEEGNIEHAAMVAEADALLVVDTGAQDRLGPVGDLFRKAEAPVYLLDHHPNPESWFKATCVRTDAAATGEIIYDLIAGHDPALIDPLIATALYVAIVTDTGSFRFRSTTPRTHEIIADIIRRGELDTEAIHVAIYDEKSVAAMRLLSRALASIQTHYGGRLATMNVSQAMFRETGALYDETEGLIQFALSLEGVHAAVMFIETKKAVKLSFRSKGDCPINGWARAFDGGGHPNAAGAYVEGKPFQQLFKEVLDRAPDHLVVSDPPDDSEAGLSDDDMELLKSFKGKL